MIQGGVVAIDRGADPDAWIDAVYQDAVIVIQVDDGAGQGIGLHTSSCSMPQVVLSMLTALDLRAGQRVLEVGTGYGAAPLAHQLGGENVVSLEIDSRLAQQARANLRKVNRLVTVVTYDGAAGYLPGAPYDRSISTAAVLAGLLPYAWVRQTRPGGMILTPWGTSFRNGAWWIEHGCPVRARYGLTITPDTQTVWVDQPRNTIATLR